MLEARHVHRAGGKYKFPFLSLGNGAVNNNTK